MPISARCITLTLLSLFGSISWAADPATPSTPAELGERLFFDVNLSNNRSQSCATCHDPQHGFVDARDNGTAAAVSLGDDQRSLGDRNAPTAAYASLIPTLSRDDKGRFIGGLFHDGRAKDLADQAAGPPLNPLEMGMPDQASVVARLRQNPIYVEAFPRLFGQGVLEQTERAYQAMTSSIAAFERTPLFSPFDSKYDRHLRGEYKMTAQEELGMTLFFSRQFTNCNLCHQLKAMPAQQGETFSSYQYHNIGVPVHSAVRTKNGVAADFVDLGLGQHPSQGGAQQAGKFKTPTLRNVAVTGPYMHNGVFRELRTVVAFYNQYNSRSAKNQTNPETGHPWGAPEVTATLSMTELEHGPALDNKRIDALVAFLKTLTDRRYEALLDAPQSPAQKTGGNP